MNVADRASAPVYRPPRKGPGRLLVELLAPGTSFRGFFEFALIGAIVLAFLHGLNVTLLSSPYRLSSHWSHPIGSMMHFIKT